VMVFRYFVSVKVNK